MRSPESMQQNNFVCTSINVIFGGSGKAVPNRWAWPRGRAKKSLLEQRFRPINQRHENAAYRIAGRRKTLAVHQIDICQ